MANPEYILIAPPAGDIPFVFPMGLIDLVKRLGKQVRGHYSWRLPPEAIRSATAAVLPIHWYFSLQPAIDLSRRLKQINPAIRIVSGGYTAGAYPEFIFQQSSIDYIVRGDAEVPFVQLMNRILDGGSVEDVPNLSWPGGGTDLDYHVDEQTLGESDNRDISWFPAFESVAGKSQRLADPAMLFPWVVVSRGCKFHCPECFASPEAQTFLAGRTMVTRPPETVKADLQYWSGRPDIRYCHFNADFISTLGTEWTATALNGRYDLTAYYEWYRLPKDQELSQILDSFSAVVFGLFFQPDSECLHRQPNHPADTHRRLADIARFCRSRARILLYVTPHRIRDYPDYYKETRLIQRSGSIELKLIDETIVPPIARQSKEEKKRGFDHLLSESRNKESRLKIQHAVLGLVLKRLPFLFGLLWKISLVRVNLTMWALSRFSGRT